MDFSKFKTSEWLLLGGGAVMLIFGLVLDWASYGGVSGNNAFDYFFTGGIAWILVVAAGVVTALLAMDVLKKNAQPWSLILLGATGLAALLMLIRLIVGAGSETAGIPGYSVTIDFDRAIGMYVAFLAAAASAAGAFPGFKESGGDLSDLKDMNKIKGQFGGSAGGGTPPPPPPPGMTPPPPPPPAG